MSALDPEASAGDHSDARRNTRRRHHVHYIPGAPNLLLYNNLQDVQATDRPREEEANFRARSRRGWKRRRPQDQF